MRCSTIPWFCGKAWGKFLQHGLRVLPQSGIDSQWYAKRILVPFGEYVPFPFRWIPGLRRLVGPVGNFTSGESFVSLDLSLENGSNLKVAPLICYEDIFPELSKGAVQHKSDLLLLPQMTLGLERKVVQSNMLLTQ